MKVNITENAIRSTTLNCKFKLKFWARHSAFLGGISKNYGTNLLVHENNVVVAEADEFDRSFLQLFPERI